MKAVVGLIVGLAAIPVTDLLAAEDQQVVTPKQMSSIVGELQACRRLEDGPRRLGCYDDMARRNAPPSFAGKLGMRTPPFELDRPHLLRFRSEGVIFVLYVFNADGEVIQNLHIGGGGEDSYLIEAAGTYSLQIDGSAEWRIWLEPVMDHKREGTDPK